MEMQACANCCLSWICLLKVVCSIFSLANTLKERSGDSNLWMKHEIIDRFIVQFKCWCETYGKVIPEDAYQVIGKFNEIFASTTKEIYAEPKMCFLT